LIDLQTSKHKSEKFLSLVILKGIFLEENMTIEISLTGSIHIHCPWMPIAQISLFESPVWYHFERYEPFGNRFPFSILNGRKVNTLIFPNLDSANVTYKIIKELDRAVSVGPILIGLNQPIHILQLGASVDEIVNMAAISVIDANERKIKK